MSNSENKQPLPCRKEDTLLLKSPDVPAPVKSLVDRLVRILPVEIDGLEYKYWGTKGDDWAVRVDLHARIDLILDARHPETVRLQHRGNVWVPDSVAREFLTVLYTRPATEFFKRLMQLNPSRWEWRGPPEKLLAKRTEEKVYCEQDYGEDQPRRLEIPNDKYDRALAALNSIGLEQVDWAYYGSYYESGHLEHLAAWGMLDVEARGDGSLWYKDLKFDFDSRTWFPVKDGPTLRGIIEAQKEMTWVDFYDKYLTFKE